jgi:hypothetical protein
MSDLVKARELENLKYLALFEELNERERQRVMEIRSEAGRRGTLISGATNRAIVKARVDKMRALIEDRIEMRKTLAIEFPELGSVQSLSELKVELDRSVENSFQGLRDSFAREARAANVDFLGSEAVFEDEKFQLKARITSGVGILEREVALDLHKSGAQGTKVSVSTGGGPAVVNMGAIYGHVQQVIGSVGDIGHQEFAAILARLAAAINETESLGAARAEYLEQVQFIAEQATVPEGSRRVGVVKAVLTGLRATLQDAANVAAILSLAGKSAAQYFGFQWPF